MHKNANKVTLLAGKYGDAPTPTIEPLNQTDFAFYDEYENSTTAGTTAIDIRFFAYCIVINNQCSGSRPVNK